MIIKITMTVLKTMFSKAEQLERLIKDIRNYNNIKIEIKEKTR